MLKYFMAIPVYTNKFFTIDNKNIEKGLTAIVNGLPLGKYCVVGGIAVQSYLPREYRRPTADIDLAIFRSLTDSGFKDFSKEIKEWLSDNGYDVSTQKAPHAYKIKAVNKDNSRERIIIEMSRRNDNNYENMRKIMERQAENMRYKLLNNTIQYPVIAPEDIVLPKLVRTVNALDRNNNLIGLVSPYKRNITPEVAKKILESLDAIKYELFMTPNEFGLVDSLRFSSDIYDIKLLSLVTGLNPSYFARASEDWNDVKKDVPQKEILLKSILPENIYNIIK